MRSMDLVDVSVAEIMSRWPSTIRVFIDCNMYCVGCPIAPFHTLVDAAEEHGLVLAELVEDVGREIGQAPVREGRAEDRPR